MHTFSNEGLENRRIILLRLLGGKDPEVHLGLDGARYTLPQVRTARGQRIAKQLAPALREACGTDAVCVSPLEAQPVQSASEQIAYVIMEPHRSPKESPHDGRWVSVDSLFEPEFRDPNDFRALHQAVAQSIASAEDTSRRPFTHLGWFREIERWVQLEIRPLGLHLSGRFRQLNAYPTFSLIRFETEASAVWFKAVGIPNEHECALTLALARSSTRFLPQVIATRPECNGWLALEAEGLLLHECSGFAPWEGAARDLAQLQIHSLDGCDRLLELSARDLRASALADLVEPFLLVMGDLMQRQPTKLPKPLSRQQLRVLSVRVLDAVGLLQETAVPRTLGHMDISPGNIVCSHDGSVFLDWAEAFVGHPFLTFEYLREHFRCTFGQGSSCETQLVARYVEPWRELVSEREIQAALAVTPLVAVFAHAVGNDRWTDPSKLDEPRTAGYLRSLTRRMEREASRLPERSAYVQVDRSPASLTD